MEDSDRTLYCGNLSPKVTEELLYELFLQTAPLQRVKIPGDKDGRQASYAFITFKHTVSVPYAVRLLDGIALYQRKIVLKPRNVSQNTSQESAPLYMPPLKQSGLKDMILRGHAQVDNFPKHLDMSPVSRRERNYNYDRRNDKPYGQVYRNRNNRFDYEPRGNHTGQYNRRHMY